MPRLVVPDFPHHVTQRGARKQKTFFGPYDYKMYIEILSKAREKSGVEIWAYCLMPNHVHLIVVPQRSDIQSSTLFVLEFASRLVIGPGRATERTLTALTTDL